MTLPETLAWHDDRLLLLDQRHLPLKAETFTCSDLGQVADAIRWMVVRGAPAIGITAAYGLAIAANNSKAGEVARLLDDLEQAGRELVATRPTAVNLRWAVDRVLTEAGAAAARFDPSAGNAAEADAVRRQVLASARRMHQEDLAVNRAMGRHGAALLPDEGTVLTHCNAGALATAGYGTALGVIRAAIEAGKRIAVLADETRPFLQGARLTAWELQKDGIPVTVITDNAAGHVLRTRPVAAVIVGADRIAGNGDTANKIGTYSLAILAREHGVPFYVAAPTSTVDLALATGDAIPIEEREPSEVTALGGVRVVPEGVPVLNPAFDVTPARLIGAIITEHGVARPPYTLSLPPLVAAGVAAAAAPPGAADAGRAG